MTMLYLPGGISASFATPEDAVAFLRAYQSGAHLVPVSPPPPIPPVKVTSTGAGQPLSALVRQYRLAANLTLAEVSRATGLTIPYLSSVELGRCTPGPVAAVALATCLGADPVVFAAAAPEVA